MSEKEEIALSEYPVATVPEKLELIDAVTIYRFKNDAKTDGRWLAVCLCRSAFGLSSRIYRWRWRSATRWNNDTRKRVSTGEYSWFLEQAHTVNKKELWEKTKAAMDGFVEQL